MRLPARRYGPRCPPVQPPRGWTFRCRSVTVGCMESLSTGYRDLNLRAVRVRPTRGAQEHRRWDRLVATHHYLSFQGLFGQALRHVATLGATWIALLGWQGRRAEAHGQGSLDRLVPAAEAAPPAPGHPELSLYDPAGDCCINPTSLHH